MQGLPAIDHAVSGKPAGQGPRRRVVIVGGGLSGAAFAVLLSRYANSALDILVIEPRPEPGRGLAYSATDPDHRLNGPLESHAIDPGRPDELREWCAADGILARDPEATLPSGYVFLRRGDYGRYLASQVAAHAVNARTGATVAHVRDTATSAGVRDGVPVVRTESGREYAADLLVVATGNPVPRLQPPFEPGHGGHPRIIANPLDTPRLAAIAPEARVLVVGTGLTALDVLSTLVRRDHRAPIRVVSRRGLRPRPHSPDVLGTAPPASPPVETPLDRIMAGVPPFVQALGGNRTLAGLVRALRAEIRRNEAAGGTWHGPFDLVRDAVWRIWPELPARDKRRFLKRLRVWYDIHRFRAPPMNETLVGSAEARGVVRFERARVTSVAAPSPDGPVRVGLAARDAPPRDHEFDYVVNCTGLDTAAGYLRNPFLQSLAGQGLLCPDDSGLGFRATGEGEAVARNGAAQPRIRVVGPPSAGAHGDPLGGVYITAQIRRILPSVLQLLEEPARAWSQV